jgi:holo-[acyl-carrier protein] synthase
MVAVPRVERLLANHGERAMKRLLTEDEREYCETRAAPAIHVAARLAAKEAAFKALAQDDDARTITWREIEVARDGDGRPNLLFRGQASDTARRLGVHSSLLSLTHVSTHAAAVVMLLG